MKPDYSLYLVTDRITMGTRTLGEAVEQAAAGGCTGTAQGKRDFVIGFLYTGIGNKKDYRQIRHTAYHK